MEEMNSQAVLTNELESSSWRRAIAPAWHTVIVLVIMLGLSLAGSVSRNAPGIVAHGRVKGYVVIMIFEWLTVAFIWYGVRRRGIRMGELVGGRWAHPLTVLRDIGIAVGFLIVAQVILGLVGHLLRTTPNQAIRNLLPQSSLEIAVYLLLALTAGICEEVIFRGYLQRQFGALTKSVAGGIALQAIAFGAGHGYQGWRYMVVIAVFGSMFGLLANWRGSLRPGMIAHFVQDGVGGIVGGRFLR